MPFLVIDRERYALQLGETTLGGDADELLALSPLRHLPPFAVIAFGGGPGATIRALPGAPTVLFGNTPLTAAPEALHHGDRLVVGDMIILYGDMSTIGQTSPVQGVDVAGTDPLAAWSQGEGTAPTGGRLAGPFGAGALGIPDEGLSIGRDPDCGLVLESRSVSRRHAVIAPGLLGYTISDLSTNGVLVNSVRIAGSALLAQGDRIRIGDVELRFTADAPVFEPELSPGPAEPLPATHRPAPPAVSAGPLLATLEVLTRGADEGKRFRIERLAVQLGRAAHNDIRITDESVSGTHATLLQRAGSWVLLDLGSRNGCYVDGERVSERQLANACEIRLGNVKLLFRAIAPAPAEQATRGIVGLTEQQLRSRT